MKSQKEKAELFRSFHHKKGEILILPNAWDVASARLFENAGFKAVATSSAGMLASLGYPDGEEIDLELFLQVVKRIAQTLTIPLSVDFVAGFGSTSEEIEKTIRKLLNTGAVGINIEDFVHETKKLVPVEIQIAKIKTIQKVGRAMDFPFVINARTDALRYAEGNDSQKFDEAVRRCRSYRDSGADCVYPMGLVDQARISQFIKALGGFPVNVMIRKGLPSVKDLEKSGVARLSFGPSASYATMGLLKRISKEILENGSFNLLLDGAISFDELESLARRKELSIS